MKEAKERSRKSKNILPSWWGRESEDRGRKQNCEKTKIGPIEGEKHKKKSTGTRVKNVQFSG